MSTAAPQHMVSPLIHWLDAGIGGVDPIDHLTRLEAKGVRIDLIAREVLCHRSNKPGPKRTVALGRCRVGDLGFTEPPTTTQLIDRVAQFGTLCPSETAAHLQEVFTVHPSSDCFSVLMAPIPDRHDTLFMLTVRKTSSGVCRLSARYAHPGHRWFLHYEVVAVIPES